LPRGFREIGHFILYSCWVSSSFSPIGISLVNVHGNHLSGFQAVNVQDCILLFKFFSYDSNKYYSF
jgi:hypothetical protein